MHVGRPTPRVDGRKKVTGEARYAGEFSEEHLVYGVIVNSAIARGQITRLDTRAALAVPGVLHVFTHRNRPKLAWFDRSYADMDSPLGSPFRPLYDDQIQFSGQPIALVVADTFEAARHAARLVEVGYEQLPFNTDIEKGEPRPPKKFTGGRKPPPKPRGDAEGALARAPVTVDARYVIPAEYHSPMEPFATTVIVESDGSFTVHDKTQGVSNSQGYVSRVFGVDAKQVRVVAPFVGGAFGAALRPNQSLFFAFMAAQALHRSVRVTLTRQQMFTFGYRPEATQRVALGADRRGHLTAIIHEATANVSRFEEYVESTVNFGPLLYRCENVRTSHLVVPLDAYTPADMRAPGAATGMFAVESAMDELADKLAMDPIALRLLNYTDRAIDEGNKPFASKELRECYRQGAERFGWERRSHTPRSMRDGDKLLGWGMATGVWDALQMPAKAHAKLSIDGTLTVGSGTTDIGTGTYTIMTQLAAEGLGLPLSAVTFELGDTNLPMAPLQGGSWTAVTVGSAVKNGVDDLANQLFKLAKKVPASPLADAKRDDVRFVDGHVVLAKNESQRVSFVDAMRFAGVLALESDAAAMPSPERAKYAHNTHSAVFVEVAVDETLGVIEVRRIVSAIAAGKILNPQTARSQISGAVVWGVSMTLHEEALVDHRLGRVMNHSFAEYHVSVNRDVGEIDVLFVDEHDPHVNALGAKGVGEIGIVGVAAAIANAVAHATGIRVRDLPITLDKLLETP